MHLHAYCSLKQVPQWAGYFARLLTEFINEHKTELVCDIRPVSKTNYVVFMSFDSIRLAILQCKQTARRSRGDNTIASIHILAMCY